ncbi:MAG: hypothetical protein QM790_07990 [Nibricoccus sp.]
MDTTATFDEGNQTVEELKALLREAEAALANVGSQTGEQVSNLREKLRQAYDESKNKLGEAADYARRQAARADEMVRANPYATVGIATAAGLLVGFLIARSCSHRA